MRRGRLFALIILFAAAVLAVVIVTDVWPGLRGPAPGTSEWHWPYSPVAASRWWPVLLVAAAQLAFGAWWLHDGRSARWPVAILAALTLLLQIALIYSGRPNVGAELVDRTLSKASNGYVATAGEIDSLGATLRQYPELMPAFDNDHARTHPPGLVVLPLLTERVFDVIPEVARWVGGPARLWRCTDLWVLSRSSSMAATLMIWSWIPLLAAALTPVVGFALARRWYRPKAAILAALLTATIPALLIFNPSPDQLFAMLSLLSLWSLVLAFDRHTWLLAAASGLVLSAMTLLSLGNLAWALLVVAFALLKTSAGLRNQESSQRTWQILVALAVGCGSLWLAYWVGWGVAPLEIMLTGFSQHSELVTSLRRYDWWLGYNLIDFTLFAGLAVVAGLCWQSVRALRDKEERTTDYGRLALLLTALLLLLLLSGSTRGEVGRLWLVFMPLSAVLAAGVVGKQDIDWRSGSQIIASQLLLVLALGLSWGTVDSGLAIPHVPEMGQPGTAYQTADLTLQTPEETAVQLAGYELDKSEFRPGDSLDLALWWQASGPTERPLTVFAHVLAGASAPLAQQDGWPVNDQWPTTCWHDGESVRDERTIVLPDDMPAGAYDLSVGMYDTFNGERLATNNGSDALILGQIVVAGD